MMRFLYLAFFGVVFLSSCTTSKPLFQTASFITPGDGAYQNFIKTTEPVIKTGDKITMSIWGHESLSVGSVNSSFSSNAETGKWLLINEIGETNLPQLGRIKLAGMTVIEANYLLSKEYGKTLKNPIINIKILNHFVTVLGEVNKPGKYPLDGNQLTLIELIGLSSGLSPYAKNDEIEVIRVVDNQAQKLRVNLRELVGLTDKNIVMQPGDIVYISPEKIKGTDDNLRKASIIAGILTGVAVIYSVFVN